MNTSEDLGAPAYQSLIASPAEEAPATPADFRLLPVSDSPVIKGVLFNLHTALLEADRDTPRAGCAEVLASLLSCGYRVGIYASLAGILVGRISHKEKYPTVEEGAQWLVRMVERLALPPFVGWYLSLYPDDETVRQATRGGAIRIGKNVVNQLYAALGGTHRLRAIIKPYPDWRLPESAALARAAQDWGLSPAQVIFVGATPTDEQTAEAGGCAYAPDVDALLAFFTDEASSPPPPPADAAPPEPPAAGA